MTRPRAAKSGSRRSSIKWLILGPLLIVFLVQLYFFLMVCWYALVNPRLTNMMSDQLSMLRETDRPTRCPAAKPPLP